MIDANAIQFNIILKSPFNNGLDLSLRPIKKNLTKFCLYFKITISKLLPLLFCLTSMSVYGQSPVTPAIGNKVFSGNDNRNLYLSYFEKDNFGTWDFSFLKAPYSSELTFDVCNGDAYKGQRIYCDLKLETSDGQKFYYKRKSGNLVLSQALLQSEMTKSGFMWADFESTLPIVYKEGMGNFTSKANISITRAELSPKYAWLSARGDTYLLEYSANYTSPSIEKGNIQINNTRDKAIQFTYNVQASGKFYILNKSKKEEYPLNPFLWPTPFRQDIAWGNFKEVKLYTDSYVDALASYKTNGRDVAEIKFQPKKDTKMIAPGEKSVVAYPNPTFGEIYFDLINYPKSKYNLEVFNVVGGKIFSYTFPDIGNTQLKADLSHLNRGIYQFVITDSNGRRLATQRINIVSP